MDGLLLLDKPAGWTSHDVVAKVRSLLRQQAVSSQQPADSQQLTACGSKIRVGHTGTLDPAATGLLILVLGKYTKRAGEFSKLDKVYEAEVTLGAVSSTGDSEGEITPESVQKPSKQAVEAVLSTFLGEIEQIPPQYSAIKIGGQRAYKAARAGKTVELEPRKVKIYEITNVKYDYPKLSLTCKVSSGTYIRSLAADIGQKLGIGAYLSALRRVSVGDFKVENALKIEDLSLLAIQSGLQK